MKNTIVPFASALFGGIIAVSAFQFTQNNKPETIQEKVIIEKAAPIQTAFGGVANNNIDFTSAAENSLQSVVHVRTIFQGQEYHGSNPFFDMLYGRPQYRKAPEGTGSGVIISDNGYIVTNNHVVNGAQQVKITLNNKEEYDAKIIGRDPSTDLALLKIEGKNLPYIEYGNSDDIKVGEWVLAVGNPFNLNSTVTAGIISAKGRDINILGGNPNTGISPVESFIQTDAAVNPGNSGGALVNTKGQLIGINAAIKSNTGSFMGYSFAIPANITKKVVSDLMEFGMVQRAFIGVSISNITSELAEKIDAPTKNGIYIAGLAEKGSARAAGLKPGDIITKIDMQAVNNIPQLQEKLSNYRPGDEVAITYLRDGEEESAKIVLRNQYGNTDIVENKASNLNVLLGAQFGSAPDKTKSRLGISYGVQVTDITAGKLMKAGVREKFIILKVDGKRINTPNDLVTALSNKKGGVLFEGVYPNGRMAYYGVGL